ncbi:hypothetical protein PIIN_08424 [Serendipita indica DSM 11827]|uniref:Uncharacterized protein n=1 Tax=Serendipita indica (strain DSM 11827) TaxID=1109443 RepID=G4TT28_SERID|nr:hypothetical protein PIIN_08424 [Serendipita indica DSM 11827]
MAGCRAKAYFCLVSGTSTKLIGIRAAASSQARTAHGGKRLYCLASSTIASSESARLVLSASRVRKATQPNLCSTRGLHQTQAINAAHVSYELPATVAYEELDVISDGLWKHVIELWEAKRLNEALELCKARLSDPHAHVPQPCVATSSQLRVMGEFLLANILLELHINEDAKQPDLTKNGEILRMLQSAKSGFTTHFPLHLGALIVTTQALAQALDREHLYKEAADEGRNVVRLSDAHLKILRKDVNAKEEQVQGAHLRFIWAQTKYCEYASQSGLYSEALTAITAGVDSMQEYMRQYPMDQKADTLYTALFTAYSLALANTAKNEASLLAASDAVKKTRQLLNRIKEKHPDGNAPELHTAVVIDALCSVIFAVHMESCKVKEFQGMEMRAICLEACDALRLESRLPETRSEGIPLDFDPSIGACYSIALLQLSSTLDDPREQITMMERAFEVILMSKSPDTQVYQAYSKVPSTVAHEYYIKTLSPGSYDFCGSETMSAILGKLTPLRIGEVKRLIQSECSTEETNRIRWSISTELQIAFNLASHMQGLCTVDVEVRGTQAALTRALINRGLYEAIDSSDAASATWREANTVLIKMGMMSPKEPDLIEQERLELLKKVEDCLSGNV